MCLLFARVSPAFGFDLTVTMQSISISPLGMKNVSFPSFSLIGADDSGSSSAALSNLNAPCFVDDVLAALRDTIGDDGRFTSQSLSVFGFCSLPGQPSGSLLLELARQTGRKQEFSGLEIVHPVGGQETAAAGQTFTQSFSVRCFASLTTATFSSSALVTEEAETGTIELTFDLPYSSTLTRGAPVLLLALEAPPRGQNLDVTFSSQSLEPDTQVNNTTRALQVAQPVFVLDMPSPAALSSQSVCVSEETSYVLLTGRRGVSRRWRVCAATASPHKSTTSAGKNTLKPRFDWKGCVTLPLSADQALRDVLIGGKSGSRISGAPLLLFSGGGTAGGRLSARHSNFPTQLSGSSKSLLSLRFPVLLELPPRLPRRPPPSSAS